MAQLNKEKPIKSNKTPITIGLELKTISNIFRDAAASLVDGLAAKASVEICKMC
jgi:hypothetical protein